VNNATTPDTQENYGDSIQTSLNLNGNKLAYTVLPLFKGHGSTVVYYIHAHNALQTEMVFLQQGDTVCFGNVGSFVLDLDNVLCSIIAGPATGFVHSIRNNCDLIFANTVMDVYDLATTKVNYPNQIYRFKHYGQYDIIYDEYARARFSTDRDFLKIQLGGLLDAFDMAANGITQLGVYYMAKCMCEDRFYRIFRTKDSVLSITTQSGYIGSAHDDVSKCGSREADFGESNVTTSIGGYVNAATVTAPVLVATNSTFSYHLTGALHRMYYDYHMNILGLSCELSCTSVYMAFLAFCEVTISALLHVVYVGRFSACHNGIDSCAFDGATSDQSSVLIRRSCIDFTLDTNEVDCTTSIGGYDTVTTTATTATTKESATSLLKLTSQYEPKIASQWSGG
jgi:hypothetical protein